MGLPLAALSPPLPSCAPAPRCMALCCARWPLAARPVNAPAPRCTQTQPCLLLSLALGVVLCVLCVLCVCRSSRRRRTMRPPAGSVWWLWLTHTRSARTDGAPAGALGGARGACGSAAAAAALWRRQPARPPSPERRPRIPRRCSRQGRARAIGSGRLAAPLPFALLVMLADCLLPLCLLRWRHTHPCSSPCTCPTA